MKALVLSGGGARGAYEAGLVCGLANAGERFDLVCGTSIGAINASFSCSGLAPGPGATLEVHRKPQSHQPDSTGLARSGVCHRLPGFFEAPT